jgi:hypothetical protein
MNPIHTLTNHFLQILLNILHLSVGLQVVSHLKIWQPIFYISVSLASNVPQFPQIISVLIITKPSGKTNGAGQRCVATLHGFDERSSISGGGSNFCLLHGVQNGFETKPTFYHWVLATVNPRVKHLGRKADYPLPSGANIKNKEAIHVPLRPHMSSWRCV